MADPTTSQGSVPDRLAARRRWLLGVVAGAAAVAGLGWALRQRKPEVLAERIAPGLWQQQFTTPQGGMMHLASLQGRPLVLNFWATWCPPCVEELPLLSAFYQENAAKGWNVVGVAVDQPEPVRRFLQKHPVAFPIIMAGASGVELGRSLGNLAGGLPFTVVLGSDGLVAHRKMGKVKPDDLQAWSRLT